MFEDEGGGGRDGGVLLFEVRDVMDRSALDR